jgi:AcrR family transcriptional regulator
MTEHAPTDHRPRVAAERRERTRQRLVESAMLVFAEKGMGASVIQEVVTSAGVSQGTFYNYFRTNEDLLKAVTEELNNELMDIIEDVVGGIENPARRISTGIRLFLRTAQAYPILARFVGGTRVQEASSNNQIFTLLPPDIEEGIAKGCFITTPMLVALELIAGTVLAAVVNMASGMDEDHPERIAEVILRALGTDASDARDIVAMPLPDFSLAPESLLVRAHHRFSVPG